METNPGIMAEVHLFAGSKAPWLENADDLKQFDEMGTPAEWQPNIEKAQALARHF